MNLELVSSLPLVLAVMSGNQVEARWDAFVVAMVATGSAAEQRSRYGDNTALYTVSPEIAHLEAPGVIDLLITRAGWLWVKDRFGANPAVRRELTRQGWIELHLDSVADFDRLSELLATAMTANA